MLDETSWEVGDRVLAPWEEEWLYPGIILCVDLGKAFIRYDDGDHGVVRLEDIEAIKLESRKTVYAKPNPDENVYLSAAVQEVDGEAALVRFKSGVSGWVELRHLRFHRKPISFDFLAN